MKVNRAITEPPSWSSETAAAATATAPAGTSLATLLASHVLRDGELVLLILKPSVWFVVLSSLRFVAGVLVVLLAAKILGPHLPGPNRDYVESGLIVISGRLIWGTMQWMGKLYVLTDLRILSVSGVFNIDVFDCPLRKVARTRLIRNVEDRIVSVGTIEIIPQDETAAFGYWQTVGKPKFVHEKIAATISRAKQGGCA